ncbi:MAG: hypothetical protein AB1589_18055 [Cyanobacteriota bacterium]
MNWIRVKGDYSSSLESDELVLAFLRCSRFSNSLTKELSFVTTLVTILTAAHSQLPVNALLRIAVGRTISSVPKTTC